MRKTIFPSIVVLLVTLASAPAATRLVPDEYATIQAAIDAAIDGDVVVLAPITYRGYGNRDIDFHGKDITIRSVDPNDPDTVAATIIDCNGTVEENHRAFYFHSGEDGNSVLSGLTITNGYAGYGGAIYCVSSHPAITNCTIRDSRAQYWGYSTLTPNENRSSMVNNDGEVRINIPPPLPGWKGKGGGICCRLSSPTLTNCKIIGNSAKELGGGMYNYDNSSPILTNCTFVSNSTSFGGAIHNSSGSPILTNCTFVSNYATYGGAIRNSSSSPRLFNCIFNSNSAGGLGGCMYNYYGCNPMLTNCTFNKNSAVHGGVIYNSGSDATLSNCILRENTATQGDEIYLDFYTDFWGNEIPSTINVDYSDIEGGAADVYVDTDCTLNWGEGNIDADPCFVSPGYWDSNGVWFEEDYHLLFTSPCIDAGDPDYVPSPGEKDIDGEPRVIGGRVDMGVDEFTSTLTRILRLSPTEFQFSSYKNGPNPKEQIMSLRNIGSGTLNWEITGDCPWLDVYPASGESTGQMNEITLSADISGMAPDSYECLLTIDADDALNSPQMVTVTLNLGGSELFVPSEYDTIQAAIDAAIDRDTVIVAEGTYTGTGNRDIDFHGKEITVRSENGPENCIINCNGTQTEPHRGFNFHSGEDVNSVVEGFTITNGHADYGGGIYCENSSPTITNCTFRDNTAKFEIGFSTMIQNGNSSSMVSNDSVVHAPPGPGPYYRGRGGGFYCRSSNPTLTNCKFIGNSGYIFGGGMCNYDNSSPILTNCTFSSNSALYGGAMSNYTANPSLFNCIFIGNSAKFDGGGIDNYENSSPILTNCTFSSNRASYGGAMNNYTATSSLFNCIFNGNSAGSKGGGMFNGNQSTFKLKNCTFNGNRAGISGGGIYSQNDPPPPPPPLGPSALTITNGISAENAYTNIYDGSASYNIIIANCILWDNEAPNGPQIYLDSDWHVWIKYNDVQGGWPGEGNIDSNPFFVEPGYWDANGVWIEGDYHLLPYSVCIDAGDPNYIAEPNETDLDGRPRVLDGNGDDIPVVDMGAYESVTPLPAEVRITPRTINLASKSKWITCYIWLPDDYSVTDIDSNNIFLNVAIRAEYVQVSEKQQVAIAEFSREEAQTILNTGEVELSIIGWLIDGTIFEGKDVIRVVQKSGGKPDRYVQASDPNPVDGETNVSITADLSWTASPYATSHDVYFGTSSPPPFIHNQVDTTFDPGTMDYEKTYYWRIDEVSKWGITTGQIWNFTTIKETPPPPPPPSPP